MRQWQLRCSNIATSFFDPSMVILYILKWKLCRIAEEKFTKMRDIYHKLRDEHVALIRSVSYRLHCKAWLTPQAKVQLNKFKGRENTFIVPASYHRCGACTTYCSPQSLFPMNICLWWPRLEMNGWLDLAETSFKSQLAYILPCQFLFSKVHCVSEERKWIGNNCQYSYFI